MLFLSKERINVLGAPEMRSHNEAYVLVPWYLKPKFRGVSAVGPLIERIIPFNALLNEDRDIWPHIIDSQIDWECGIIAGFKALIRTKVGRPLDNNGRTNLVKYMEVDSPDLDHGQDNLGVQNMWINGLLHYLHYSTITGPILDQEIVPMCTALVMGCAVFSCIHCIVNQPYGRLNYSNT